MSRLKRNTRNLEIPLFIQKLCKILEDQYCQPYINWTPNGHDFNIKDINKFTEVVLPKYFKQRNFSSFIRQLNMYGFSKVRSEQGQNIYTNVNFKKGQRQLLENIRRKINLVEKDDKLALYSSYNGNNLNKQLSQLKSRQKNLQSICQRLIEQNNHILEQNNVIMKKLATQKKQKNSKMQQLLISLIIARSNNQLTIPSSEQPSILSLTHQKPDLSTTFEEFRQFLEGSHDNNRLQQALKNFNHDQKKRNKNKNFTIIQKNQRKHIKPKSQSQSKIVEQNSNKLQSIKVRSQDQDNSMCSLGDFLNLDQDPLNSSAFL